VHLLFSFVAIGAGALVIGISKGTRWHRTVGHIYVTAMIGLIVSALSIYDLTGNFGPFHVAAIVATITLFMGLASVLLRRPRKQWIEAHATWMSWSYIGLIAAFLAESLSRFVMPREWRTYIGQNGLWSVFWASVGLTSVAVCVVGAVLVAKRLPRAVASTPEAMRRERSALRDAAQAAGESAG
jgi:uncharacterized membrane protein